MPELILQENNGRYVSDLINDRYQVLESTLIDNEYYVYDLIGDTIPFRENDNSITLFKSVDSAIKRINNVKEKRITNSEPIKSVLKKKVRGESALSYMKELISTTDLNDNEIADKVKERFPESNYNHSMVKFNRKKLATA